MAVTYAPGVTPANTTTPYNAIGSKQNARRRAYQTTITYAAQAIADEIVVARPHPGERMSSIRVMTSVTTGTATLALKVYDKNGTVLASSPWTTAVAVTTANTWTELAFTATTIPGTVLDGGELRLVVAAAALPGAGSLCVEIGTIGY